jgi:predicted acylesterase/phospholipase RssA
LTEAKYNPPLTGPVIGQEPDFLAGMSMDNAVGAIIALTAEVYMLRERLQSLEAELTGRKLLPAGAVENHQTPPADAARRQDDLAAFTQRVMSELTRDRTPLSRIDPSVASYLKTHAQLQAEGKI